MEGVIVRSVDVYIGFDCLRTVCVDLRDLPYVK
jgi:hypothetical protein